MTRHENPRRVSAQIACEAIINHPQDGYDLADMCAVFEIACAEGVGALYVDMLADLMLMTAQAGRMARGARAQVTR